VLNFLTYFIPLAVIRHGDRLPLATPCWRGEATWTCNLNAQERQGVGPEPALRLYTKKYMKGHNIHPGSCAQGQLTQRGYNQHVANGQLLRRHYIDKLRFLPFQLNSSLLWIRSDDVARVLASAEALLMGLYPPQSRPVSIETIDLNTEDFELQDMFANDKLCPRLRQIEHQWQQTATYIQHYNNVTLPLRSQFATALGLNVSQVNLGVIFDCMSTHICNRKPLPKGLTMDMYKSLKADLEWNYAHLYNFPDRITYGKLALGRLYVEIFEALKSVLETSATAFPFVLFSGHDATLMPMTFALGISDNKWTPYASLLLFEVYSQNDGANYYVRAIYNGQEKKLVGCYDVLCPVHQFLNTLKSLMLKDESECAPHVTPPLADLTQKASFVSLLFPSLRDSTL
jgi:hypothetical protein